MDSLGNLHTATMYRNNNMYVNGTYSQTAKSPKRSRLSLELREPVTNKYFNSSNISTCHQQDPSHTLSVNHSSCEKETSSFHSGISDSIPLSVSRMSLNTPTRPLTLSINHQYQPHSESYPPSPIQLTIQHDYIPIQTTTPYRKWSESSSVQGPNTQEYFGHDAQQAHYGYTNHIHDSDVTDTPSDPYDSTSGEQQFCGGYGEWGHVITRTERTILPDLKQYAFTDDIKNQADVIYNKMIYRVRRGKIRSQMLFFCVYCAHLELNRDVNPTQLGSLFDLTPGEVQRCDSIFSPLQTGYRPPSTNTSPLRYLPGYCEKMELSEEAVTEIMRLANNVLRKDPDLRQENPQTVAAGLLRYFTYTNGIITDDPQKITKVTGRSNVTIDVMFRRIATIDNN